ncbi:MAG TPA: hypothetical protein VNU75_03065, partial [Acidimicrobiales bacterium]|nr:hypothetical protein [Acidimicrobiales bacterium]
MAGPRVNGPEDEGDLPWPRPDPGDGDETADAEPGSVPPEEPEDHRLERRARRQALVRRRRRVLALVGGALLLVVLGFVLWYELESHALGPPGKQVVVTVKPGESTSS